MIHTISAYLIALVLLILPGAWLAFGLPLQPISFAARLAIAGALSPLTVGLQFYALRFVGASFEATASILLVLNLGPFAGLALAPGWARLGYALAWGAMALIYLCMSRYSLISPLYVVLHPISTLLFAGTLLRSMFLALGRGGVVWRGTKYPLEELRKGLV